MVWSDKTKINCLGSDGCKWVWKKSGEGLSDRLVEGTVKFGGGSIMIWGCMTWEGVGYAEMRYEPDKTGLGRGPGARSTSRYSKV